MDPDVREILVQADEAGACEHPSDFDYQRLWAEIDALKPELEALTSVALDVDNNVQDASHLTDIRLYDEPTYDARHGGKVIHTIFGFRFSNFARLFTMWGTGIEGRSDEFRLEECLELISSRGFVYISADQLDEEYDGINISVGQTSMSWWNRYFDYI